VERMSQWGRRLWSTMYSLRVLRTLDDPVSVLLGVDVVARASGWRAALLL
jgi:hypothetical protein